MVYYCKNTVWHIFIYLMCFKFIWCALNTEVFIALDKNKQWKVFTSKCRIVNLTEIFVLLLENENICYLHLSCLSFSFPMGVSLAGHKDAKNKPL